MALGSASPKRVCLRSLTRVCRSSVSLAESPFRSNMASGSHQALMSRPKILAVLKNGSRQAHVHER